MISPTGQNLVFVLSTPRAGSTLLSAILANHSRVLCPNEPWFLLGLRALYYGGNRTVAAYEHSGVETALREFLTEEEFLEAARAFALAAYNRRLAAAGKEVFADKTPRYYHILPFVDRLFPEAKKVWLKRNPLDVAASYQTSWNLQVEDLFDPTFGPMALDLTLGLARLAAFFQGQPGTCEWRYEDLVQQPEPTLRALCAFLGLEYEPGLDHYGANPAALEARKARRMGDRKLFEHARPHSASIGRCDAVLTPPQIQRLLDCLGAVCFERLGYGDTVQALRARGFRFPDERAVAENRAAFEAAARTLPWAGRKETELGARCAALEAERDRLRVELERRRAERAGPLGALAHWWQNRGRARFARAPR